MNRRIISLILLPAFALGAVCQVNTERLRRDDLREGFGGRLEAGLAFAAGNAEFSRYRLGTRLDWLRGGSLVFLSGSLQRERSGDSEVSHKGFSHLRAMLGRRRPLGTELFLQEEFSEQHNLKERRLAGLGLRWAPFSGARDTDRAEPDGPRLEAWIGGGLMWEREVLDAPGSGERGRSDLLRSTSYLNLRWRLRNTLLSSVTYFQVDVTHFADYRVLNESSLELALGEHLRLSITLDYRNDSEPAAGLARGDLEIVNGLAYQF